MQILAVLALAAQAAAAPPYSTELRGEDLMKALQSGGYTILLRHARTDWSFKEEVGSVPVERSAQRNLSADGVRDAALMGVVLKRYRIPIGEIVASPMFRARETAEYAAGTPTISMALRVFPTTDETAAIVSAAPKPGTNRLLVTHHFVIEKLVPGIKPGDVAESEAAVVRPTGDGSVVLVGRITLGDWEQLAGVPKTVPAAQGGQPLGPVAGNRRFGCHPGWSGDDSRNTRGPARSSLHRRVQLRRLCQGTRVHRDLARSESGPPNRAAARDVGEVVPTILARSRSSASGRRRPRKLSSTSAHRTETTF